MAAVTGSTDGEGATAGDEPVGGAREGVHPQQLGAIRAEPRELGNMHKGLTFNHWIRSALSWYLQRVRLRHEWNGHELLLKVTESPAKDAEGPYIPRNAVPWSQMARPMREVKVWSYQNAKMDCPSFDLPTGAASVGGSCPGAVEGQTISPGRRGVLSATGARVDLPRTICNSCLTGDALIMVRGEGLKRIDQMLNRTFEVWSGDAWERTSVLCNGTRAVVELRLTNGQNLFLTEDHKVLTVDGWKEAKDITDEDQLPVMLPKESPFPASALTCIPEMAEKYRTEKRGKLPLNWSRQLGVFLGYMAGDGSFNNSDRYPTATLVAAEKDVKDIEKLAALVSEWTGSTSEVSVGTPAPSSFCENPSPQAHVAWRSKSLSHLLTSLGLKKEGALMRVPSSIWVASAEGVAGFLSGLFSTDGSVSAQEVSLASTSLAMLDEVQQLLAAFGIRTSRCEYKSNRERGFKTLMKLSICGQNMLRFEEAIGFFNERKAKKLREMNEQKSGKFINKPLYVASVEATDRVEMVYDLENVGPDHRFVANGIVVHNCYVTAGPFGYTSNQLTQMLRHVWVAGMLNHDAGQFVDVMSESIIAMPDKLFPSNAPGNILPIRIHSAGDFFDFRYASAWLDICNRVAQDPKRGRRFKFWAPTRTWVVKGWPEWWRKNLDRLKQDNLLVRASAFHFDDPAPGSLDGNDAAHSVTGMGSTSMHDKGLKSVTAQDFFAKGEDKKFYDWRCPTFSDVGGSCTESINPHGKTHCRACWTQPTLRIEYPAH